MKKVKPLFEQRILLQIISVVSAVILWFAITYSENPSVTRIINGISLSFNGESSLEKNGLIFVNSDKLPPVAVEVRGRRNEIQSVLNSVSATVDLNDITEAGEYTREVVYDIPGSSVMITKKKTTTVNITVEKATSKEIPVVIRQIGAEKNRNHIIKSTAGENNLKLYGTSDDLSKIAYAVLTVDVSEMSESNSGKYNIGFADANNSAVTPVNHISVPKKNINVNNDVYFRTVADIKLSPKYDDGDFKINVKSFSQDKVEVGVKSRTDTPLELYAEFKNDSAVSESGKYEMTLVVPDNIYCPEYPEGLVMNAEISSVVTREISVVPEVKDLTSGVSVSFLSDELIVSVTGTEDDILKVSASISLAGLGKGSYELPVTFNGNAKINGDYTIGVVIE